MLETKRCLIASHGVTLHRANLRAPSRIWRPYPQNGDRMKLSFLDIKNARPGDKPYRISDGDGLTCKSSRTATSSGAIATASQA